MSTEVLLTTEAGDVITTEAGDGLKLYGYPEYSLYVDWNGDGTLDQSFNEAERLLRFTIDRGRDSVIGGSGSGFTGLEPGVMNLELDNSDRRYDPWYTAGALYGLLRPGRKIQFVAYYELPTGEGIVGTGAILFTGFVTDIRVNGFADTVTITAEDGAGWLRSVTPNIPLTSSTGVDTAISAILANVNYPFDTDIEGGIESLPYYWTSGGNALDEICALACSDLGRFAVEADGTAHFLGRYNSDYVVKLFNEERVGQNIYLPMPWEYARTSVEVRAYPVKVGSTDSVIFTLRDKPLVSGKGSIEVWADYNFEDVDVPATGVYKGAYTANTSEDGTGTDLTSDFTVTLTAYSRKAKLVIANGNVADGYVTALSLLGTPIKTNDVVSVKVSSTDAYALPSEFVFDYAWLSDTNTAATFADVLLTFLSAGHAFPTLTIYNYPTDAFRFDLEQRARIKLDTYGIDETFYVHKISHASGASPHEVITTVQFYPMLTSSSQGFLVLDSADYGKLDTAKLGF